MQFNHLIMTLIMTIDIYTFLIVCPFVFLSGFVDAVAGGGGLVSLPAYFISGLPTHFALGTNKLSAMLGTALTTYKYARLGYINVRRAFFCVICAFAGSSIGAKLALLVPDREFKIALLFILPLTALYLLKNRSFGEDKHQKLSEKVIITLCSVVSLVVGIYDGIYGPGTGTFLLIGFCTFANCTLKNANGLAKAVNLATNFAAFTVFCLNDSVIFSLGLVAGIFSVAGNYAGARFFEKNGAIGTKPIMIFVIGIFIIKICYDLIS